MVPSQEPISTDAIVLWEMMQQRLSGSSRKGSDRVLLRHFFHSLRPSSRGSALNQDHLLWLQHKYVIPEPRKASCTPTWDINFCRRPRRSTPRSQYKPNRWSRSHLEAACREGHQCGRPLLTWEGIVRTVQCHPQIHAWWFSKRRKFTQHRSLVQDAVRLGAVASPARGAPRSRRRGRLRRRLYHL